eukprot:SM002782S10352  [mRNA]  locus=s2782:799:1269:+ [translate_table: standard]
MAAWTTLACLGIHCRQPCNKVLVSCWCCCSAALAVSVTNFRLLVFIANVWIINDACSKQPQHLLPLPLPKFMHARLAAAMPSAKLVSIDKVARACTCWRWRWRSWHWRQWQRGQRIHVHDVEPIVGQSRRVARWRCLRPRPAVLQQDCRAAAELRW